MSPEASAAWDRIPGVVSKKSQQNAAKGSSPDLPAEALLHSAALAAELLEAACAPGAGDPLRLDVVRTLARDLARELESLVAIADWTSVIEGALRAADVANLAACTAPELMELHAPQAVASTHLASGAARALCTFARASIGEVSGEHAQNALKDIRGAVWRARLAANQVDEFSGDPGQLE